MDNRIDHLVPWVSQRAQAWLEMAQAYVLPLAFPGCKVRITETLRDDARQAEVKAAGLSAVAVGYHNFGRAWDFICLDENGVLLTDGTHPIYSTLGRLAECLGLKWGGTFQQWITLPDGTRVQKPKPDYDHIEDRSHGSVDDLVARKAAGLET